MALSFIPSSSSSPPQFKYDVFLSFRGEDTRYNFTSHLHKALRDKAILTFIDDKLNRGDEISPSLLKTVEESQISIIIFSKCYADSRWCLEELAKIMECKKRYGQIIIPVFYNVDPSDVRNQTGTYGDAFTIHEERFKEYLEKVQIWKNALKEAANLSGWHSSINKDESEFIESIVNDILERLDDKSSSDDKDLVGIDSKIEHIVSLLGTNEVCHVGIWGIGGIGKTTLAKAIFNKIHRQFEGSYFALNVREEFEQTRGLKSLREKLHSTLLRKENVNTDTFTGNRLGRKKLLIVFDDMTDFEQLEYLIGSLHCLSSQSRIIVTTRDKQVLDNCGVNCIYKVKELIHSDARKLFCRYAFKQNLPIADYTELSERVLLCAGGLPLALKVLGSFLHNKSKEVWKSAIIKLGKIPNNKIHEVLKISYDGLDDEVQKIFLDIACFFIGSEVGPIKVFLEACGISVDIGISILMDNHLIIESNNVIRMHDLLRAMGREIVRQESIEDPGKRSRLWYHEDIDQVLRTNTGTGRIEGISLDMSKVEDIYLNRYAFMNIHRLRFLKFYNSSFEENRNKVHGFEALDSNFAALRYLNWYKCPLESLPSRFDLKNLVTLEMHESRVKQLWNDVQVLHLGKLKEVDLSSSRHFTISCVGFSISLNLERLVLQNCAALCEIPSSIQGLRNLNFLDLTFCVQLKSLPNLIGLTSLKKLDLSHCRFLKMLPEMPCNIEELRLAGIAIEELSSSIEDLSRLVILDLNNCTGLKSLPNNICKWKSLECLYLSDCVRLDKLPNNIGILKSLRHLRVESSGIKEVPSSIVHLNNLHKLNFRRCKCLLSLPPLTGLNNLGKLDLTECGVTKIPDSVGDLSSLKILNLGKNNLESIPASIINLSNLQSLDISFSRRPLSVHHVEVTSITETNTLQEILQKVAVLIGRRYCKFTRCFQLDQNILKDIVKDALPEILPKIQGLAIRSKKYRDKEFEDVPTTANICYPASEIPEWFNVHSSESVITVKLPQNWFDNFVGFTFCSVVAFSKHGSYYNLSISCQYSTSKDGQRHVVSEVVIDTPYIDCPYKSKYVIIGFDSRLFPHQIGESLHYSDEVSFQIELMELNDFSKHSKSRNKVEKCGVRLMYAQTHLECNTIMSCGFRPKEEKDEINRECNTIKSCGFRPNKEEEDEIDRECSTVKWYGFRPNKEEEDEIDRECNTIKSYGFRLNKEEEDEIDQECNTIKSYGFCPTKEEEDEIDRGKLIGAFNFVKSHVAVILHALCGFCLCKEKEDKINPAIFGLERHRLPLFREIDLGWDLFNPRDVNFGYYGQYEDEEETNQVGISEIRGDHWKIIFENGCQVKVICEDLGLKWEIDPQTGDILTVGGAVDDDEEKIEWINCAGEGKINTRDQN